MIIYHQVPHTSIPLHILCFHYHDGFLPSFPALVAKQLTDSGLKMADLRPKDIKVPLPSLWKIQSPHIKTVVQNEPAHLQLSNRIHISSLAVYRHSFSLQHTVSDSPISDIPIYWENELLCNLQHSSLLGSHQLPFSHSNLSSNSEQGL